MKKSILIAGAILIGSFGFAQEKNEDKYYINSDRNWLIELPLWVPGFRGQFAFGDVSLSTSGEKKDRERKRINNSLGLEFYFVGRAAVRYNNFWGSIDGFSGKISSKITYDRIIGSNQPELLNLNIQLTLTRLIVGYAVWKKTNESDLVLEIIPNLGARYYNVHLGASLLDSIYSGDIRKSWVDPIIGIYIPVRYKRFLFKVQGDISLFTSNLTWAINGQANYRISPLIDVKIGWSHINYKKQSSVNDINLELNIVLSGPSLGVGFRF